MFLAMMEILVVIFAIWFVVSQMVIPLASGTKTLPLFRSPGKKAVVKDLILDEKDRIEEEELRKCLKEMRQKGKKENGKV